MVRFLKKCFSALILTSYTLYALTPTIAFAMDKVEDNRVQSIFSPPPVSESQFDGSTTATLNQTQKSRKSSDFTEELRHKKLFEPLIDNRTESLESESSTSRRALPSLQSLSSDEDQLVEFAHAYPLYEDLEVNESLLCWKRLGFEFTLHVNGDLFVKKAQRNRLALSALRVFNPNGDLILNDQINVRHLLLKAKNVVHQGENQTTKLEVWAMGDEELKGVFQNTHDAELKVSEILLHQGYFQNHGNIFNLCLLRLSSGINEAYISAKNLRLIINELFSNAGEGLIDSENSLTTEGMGTILQEGCFLTKNLFINNAEFEERAGIVHTYNDLHLGSLASRYSLSKGTLWAKSVLVDKDASFLLGAGEHLLTSIDNKGLITLFNKAHIQTQALLNSYGTIESTESLRFIALFNGKLPRTTQWDIPTITITKMKKGVNHDQTLAASNLRPGALTVRDDLILELDPQIDIFNALDRFNDKWRQGRKLMIYGDKLLQTKDFMRGGHSAFYVNEYVNPGYEFTGNAFEFFLVNPPTIGSSNDRIGKIVTVFDPSKPSYQDNRLTFTIEKGDVHLPYADLFGHGKTKITLLGGNLVYGNSPVYQTRTSDISPNGNFNFNYGPDEPSNFHVAPYSSTYKAKNKSHLGSNAYIGVSVPNYHNMTFAYTTVEAKWYMELFAKGGAITNLSSKIQANGRITPYAYSYTNTRDKFERLYSCPYRWNGGERMTMYKDFETSDRAKLLSAQNSIYFEVMKVLSDASDIKARERVFNNKQALKGSSSFTTQSRTLGHYYLNRVFAGGMNLEEGFPKGYGITEELTASDNLVEAKVVDLAFRDQKHDGHLSAEEAILRGHNLSMTGDPNVKVKDGRPPATIDAGKIKLQFENSAALKNANLIAREKDIKAKIKGNLTLEQVKMIAHRNIDLVTHELKLSHSSVSALKNINLEATETDITLLASTLKALEALNITSARDVKAESLTQRQGDADNYADSLIQTILKAGQNLKVKAGQDIKLKGILTESGTGTKFKADRHVIDEAIALVTQTYFKDENGYSRTKITRQEISKHLSSGNFQSKAKGVQILYAHIVEALNILIEGDQGVYENEVHDTYEHESQKVKKGDGFFQNDSKENNQIYQAVSKGVHHKAKEQIKIKSEFGSLHLTNINYVAPQILLEAIKSVNFHDGTNYYSSSHSSSESNLFFQSQDIRREEHRTYSQNQISGNIKITSPEVNIERVAHQAIEWLDRIELHGAENINFILLEELHKVEEHSVAGPTAALSAVIALAATLATQGAGSWLAGNIVGATQATGMTATVLSGMSKAFIASLASKAALALANSNGDFNKAIQDLTNNQSFKSLGLAIATAGIKELAGSIVSNLVTGLITKQKPADIFKGIVADEIGRAAAHKIGTDYNEKKINAFAHKLEHALLGAFTGGLISQDFAKGAVAGGMGAFVSETFADMFKPEKLTEDSFLQKAQALEHTKGRRLNNEEKVSLYIEELKD